MNQAAMHVDVQADYIIGYAVAASRSLRSPAVPTRFFMAFLHHVLSIALSAIVPFGFGFQDYQRFKLGFTAQTKNVDSTAKGRTEKTKKKKSRERKVAREREREGGRSSKRVGWIVAIWQRRLAS